MKNENYAALVALDWGDKTHAFARQVSGAERIEQGSLEATPEALHAWLEQLGRAHEGKPVALAFLRRFPELAEVKQVRPATLSAFYRQHNARSAERLALAAKARALIVRSSRPPGWKVALLVDLLAIQARHIGRSLQKYAGLAPVREKGGQKLWTHWRWAAPKFLQQSFVEWAGQTVVHCDWAGAYYRKQTLAGKAHHAILRALAFKSIRILWRCWHDNKPYDQAHYLAALCRHRSPPASALPKIDIIA